MTTLEWWNGPFDMAQHYRVNGCLRAKVTELEARHLTAIGFIDLAWRRVAAMVWAAMPGHEDGGPS